MVEPPVLADEELAYLLQEVVVAVEETQQGWSVALLEAVAEAARPLTYGKMNSLEGFAT